MIKCTECGEMLIRCGCCGDDDDDAFEEGEEHIDVDSLSEEDIL